MPLLLDLDRAGRRLAPPHRDDLDPLPRLARADRIVVNLSGGKDGLRAGAIAMAAARAVGVEDRVYSVHASMGPLEWPSVRHKGTLWPGSSELAAQHSRLLGIAPERHIEVTRTRLRPDGTVAPYHLLTFIAERGDWPWKGKARWCTGMWKTDEIEKSYTPFVQATFKAVRRPVRILSVLGIRADESTDRSGRAPWRTTTNNGHREVTEWLPALTEETAAVLDWTDRFTIPRQWCYDSRPGAGDWKGSTRCSCATCVFSGRRDLLLTAGRRPRLTALCGVIERTRLVQFNPARSINQLIALARRFDAPEPGIVIQEEGPEFDAMEADVRAALRQPPRRQPRPQAVEALRTVLAECGACECL